VNGHRGSTEVLLRHGAKLGSRAESVKEADGGNVGMESETKHHHSSQLAPGPTESTAVGGIAVGDLIAKLRDVAIRDTNAALSQGAAAGGKTSLLAKRHNISPPQRRRRKTHLSATAHDSGVRLREETEEGKRGASEEERAIYDGDEPGTYWCHVCQHYRPPLAHHSEVCGVCVDGFVEYCRLVSNAIGKRNYGFYLGLLLSSAGFSLGCLFPSLYIVVAVVTGSTAPGTYFWETLLAMLSLMLTVPLCSLALFHVTAAVLQIPIERCSQLHATPRGNNGEDDDDEDTRTTSADESCKVTGNVRTENIIISREGGSRSAGSGQMSGFQGNPPTRFGVFAQSISKVVRLIRAPVPASDAVEAAHNESCRQEDI
jgi:hypothetical protein